MSKIIILSTQDQRRFDAPPIFSIRDRMDYFLLSKEALGLIVQLRTPTNKVGFLLQLGYFKANGKFFNSDQFRRHDIDYVSKILGISQNKVDLSVYQQKISNIHRKKILDLENWKEFDSQQREKLFDHITWIIQRQLLPKQVFLSAIDFCWVNKIELPSYNILSIIITDAYNRFELNLVNILDRKLTTYHKEKLNQLAGINFKTTEDTNLSSPPTLLKYINQSMRPLDIQESVDDFKIFNDCFREFKPIIEDLNLPDQSTEYFATWVQKARTLQLQEFSNRNKLYLYLLCYIKNRLYVRNDFLLDTFLKAVQSAVNAANSQLNKLEKENRAERNKAIRKLSASNKEARELINQITQIIESPGIEGNLSKVAEEKLLFIKQILNHYNDQHNTDENQELKLLEKSLDKISKNHTFFDALESLSLKLQRKIAPLLKVLEFNPITSDSNLLEAINHFALSDGNIGNNPPLGFLKEEEKETLYIEDKLRISLYKVLLCVHTANAIKSGRLNLLNSYRYKAIYEYLIDKDTWEKNKNILLTNAGLINFMDFEATVDQLRYQLDNKYITVNERLLNNENPYLRISLKGNLKISTPKIDSDNREYASSLLSHAGYIPILQVLGGINQITQFAESFEHFSIKHKKMKTKPATIFAGIIAKGCNIGIRRMANISTGISEDILKNTVTWCFSLKNIQKANNKIISLTNKLSLTNIYRHNSKELHTGSDGRKVNVSVDSLHGSYSYKYFGKGKGVSIYAFLDERHLLFHSTVISASEREAPYVIDGLLQNDVVKSTIHSTDTHGFTETVFAAAHFINTAFAPRIKNIAEQKIYSFSARNIYEKKKYKLLPSRSINLRLIEEYWDDILRFMATIKLKHTSASQLFKRLSSYAKDNPLYKAIKEFGRIIKSIFILTYLDDLELRQRIEKQLNKVELSNKFSKAVFFANNQEFKFGLKEEQEGATACKVLIQNSIILWNYLYISQLIANNENDEERKYMVKYLKKSSMLSWQHINLHGEYDFTKNIANDDIPFDLVKILNLNVA